MEKINIAEILKDCPKGMELDCTLYDNCTFDSLEDRGYIEILVNTPSGKKALTKFGCYIWGDSNAKCVIFPKGKTTWEGFQRPFKVGDRIERFGTKFTIIGIVGDYYLTKCGKRIRIDNQDNFNLVLNKFDITTLKPFDKVLVRDKDTETWEGEFYSRYYNNSGKPYICIGIVELSEYKQCIPYEGNEHLLGTTDDCDEYYKTWE